MRIRMNGPDIEKFDTVRYAKAWVAAGKFRTDEPMERGRSSKTREKMRELHDEEMEDETGKVIHRVELDGSNLY